VKQHVQELIRHGVDERQLLGRRRHDVVAQPGE